MNYYAARQHQDTKLWKYTFYNDNQCFEAGNCTNHEGHETKEQAEECYKDYLLESNFNVIVQENQMNKCAICGVFTQNIVSCGYGIPIQKHLCSIHCDKETFRQFLHVEEIISSY